METERKQRGGLFWVVIIGAALFLCLCAGAAGVGVGGYLLLRDAEGASLQPFEIGEIVPEQAETLTEAQAELDQGWLETAVPIPTQPDSNSAAPTLEPKPTRELETAVSPPTPIQQENGSYTDIQTLDLSLLYEVWNLVQERFDGELPTEEAFLNALISGSLNSLDDQYTRYIDPVVATRLREDAGGSVSGIGAIVQENEDGFLQIVAPIKGQPAELAGLLPGDIIVGLDGINLIGMSSDQVLLMVRGPAGTEVTLEIVREGEEKPLLFTITRARFEVAVVEYELLEENIAYVQLMEFNQVANVKILEALDVLLAQNPRGVILDLRNNPGGYLNQSIAIADIFLPDSLVLLERNNQGLDQQFRATTGDVGEEIPLVVLINRGSASASEIVAGALQDNGRATIIGETSFGKGSIQQVYELSNGGELRVTIARFFTPNNVRISDNGIAPDILVEMPLNVPFGSPEDVQLQRAIEFLQNGE